MKTHKPKVAPLPLAQASPVTADERADLELILGVDLSNDWPAIRQCLRCLTQGKVIDSGNGDDDKPYVRDCTALEAAARAAMVAEARGLAARLAPHMSCQFSGREAARAVALLSRSKGIDALTAARSLAFTLAAIQSRAEWDAWRAEIEAARAERRAKED